MDILEKILKLDWIGKSGCALDSYKNSIIAFFIPLNLNIIILSHHNHIITINNLFPLRSTKTIRRKQPKLDMPQHLHQVAHPHQVLMQKRKKFMFLLKVSNIRKNSQLHHRSQQYQSQALLW
jgi:hypothetical protein